MKRWRLLNASAHRSHHYSAVFSQAIKDRPPPSVVVCMSWVNLKIGPLLQSGKSRLLDTPRAGGSLPSWLINCKILETDRESTPGMSYSVCKTDISSQFKQLKINLEWRKKDNHQRVTCGEKLIPLQLSAVGARETKSASISVYGIDFFRFRYSFSHPQLPSITQFFFPKVCIKQWNAVRLMSLIYRACIWRKSSANWVVFVHPFIYPFIDKSKMFHSAWLYNGLWKTDDCC